MKKNKDESLLTKAAVTAGSIAGEVARTVGLAAPAEKPHRSGKFPKTNKSRLPRKEKKANQKAAARGRIHAA